MVKEFQEYAIFWLKENWRNIYSVIDSFLEEKKLSYDYYDILNNELKKIQKMLDI